MGLTKERRWDRMSPIVARLNLRPRSSSTGLPPVRAYIHEAGLLNAYEHMEGAAQHLYEHLDLMIDRLTKYADNPLNFAIAIMWGAPNPDATPKSRQFNRYIDFVGFSGISEWPGNPDVRFWLANEGTIRGKDSFLWSSIPETCGDSMVILGREEDYRRTTPNLDYFSQNPPHLRELQPVHELKTWKKSGRFELYVPVIPTSRAQPTN